MAEFIKAIGEAMAAARMDLETAQARGELDDAIVHEGRLEELRRLALDHGVACA